MKPQMSILIATFALLASACSVNLSIGGQDPAEASAELIETELAELINLGPIAATCDSPESVEVGTTWQCEGVVDAGTIDFEVEVDREDHLNIQTKNVVLANQVQTIAVTAMRQLNESVGQSLPDEAMDCGTSSVILSSTNEFVCALGTGADIYDTTITITDPDTAAFTVVVADTPRS